jgi:hypothetical protein
MHNGFLIEIKEEKWGFIKRTNLQRDYTNWEFQSFFNPNSSHNQEQVKYIPFAEIDARK